jgi:hypothetical protein
MAGCGTLESKLSWLIEQTDVDWTHERRRSVTTPTDLMRGSYKTHILKRKAIQSISNTQRQKISQSNKLSQSTPSNPKKKKPSQVATIQLFSP